MEDHPITELEIMQEDSLEQRPEALIDESVQYLAVSKSKGDTSDYSNTFINDDSKQSLN